MIKSIFSWIFGSQNQSLEELNKQTYTRALASYLAKYGVPTGTKSNQWAEPEAREMLGKRSLLYKFYNSKIEAIEAATLINEKK